MEEGTNKEAETVGQLPLGKSILELISPWPDLSHRANLVTRGLGNVLFFLGDLAQIFCYYGGRGELCGEPHLPPSVRWRE